MKSDTGLSGIKQGVGRAVFPYEGSGVESVSSPLRVSRGCPHPLAGGLLSLSSKSETLHLSDLPPVVTSLSVGFPLGRIHN